MDAGRSSFEHAFAKFLGESVGALLVWSALLALVAVGMAALFLSTRSKGMGLTIKFVPGNDADATPRQPMAVSSTPPPAVQNNEFFGQDATPPAPVSGRDAFLKGLDGAERVVASIYLSLLCLVLAAATFAMAWIYFEYPDDGNRDFMLFYGGVIYLVGMLALTNQIVGTKHRLRRRPAGPTLIDQLGSKLRVSVQSAPSVGFIDVASLERARLHLAGGGTLDEACALVDPRYPQMSGWSKDAFRRAVAMALDARDPQTHTSGACK